MVYSVYQCFLSLHSRWEGLRSRRQRDELPVFHQAHVFFIRHLYVFVPFFLCPANQNRYFIFCVFLADYYCESHSCYIQPFFGGEETCRAWQYSSEKKNKFPVPGTAAFQAVILFVKNLKCLYSVNTWHFFI